MDLAFDDVWLVAGLNRGQGHFSNFLVPPIYFITQKVYFSWLMRADIGLIMLAVCTVLSPGFLDSYWSAGFGTFL